jgi:addiction module RelE/StbE family toxin
MKIVFTKQFSKQFVKVDTKIKIIFSQKMHVFQIDKYDPSLRNHALLGEWAQFRSINITGDFRVLYIDEPGEVCVLHAIGTHSQLYG